MNQRYQNADINRVSKEQADNELYKVICTIGAQLESELAEFGLCPEECFEETLEVLTILADKGEEAIPELDTLWHRKFNEYRRFDRKVAEEELRKAVGIVLGFVILAIDSSRYHFYRYTLTEALTKTIANPKHQFADWAITLEKILSVPLSDGWFDSCFEEIHEEDDEIVPQNGLPLPKVLNTQRAQTYFQKAIDSGFIKLDCGKFSWITIGAKGGNSQLAYFCGRVFEYEHSANGNAGTGFPEKELNKIFEVTRMYSSLTQVYNAKKVQPWRRKIDELFE